MPIKPAHPCAYPGCPELVRDGRYCPAHSRTSQAAYDRDRGTAAQRGYGGRWQRLRAIVLRANPLCVDPYHRHPEQVVPATEVDHIIPKRQGGTDSVDNLQSLCRECHNAKTARGE